MPVNPSTQKPVIDADFFKAFAAAAQAVFATQCNLIVQSGQKYIKKPDEYLHTELAGVINLIHSAFTGSLFLCFTLEVYLKVYENMVGEKHTRMTPELQDGAAELLNMIFGQINTNLNKQKGHTFEITLAKSISGEELELLTAGKWPIFIMPFDSLAGTFHIKIVVGST